ncbi:hypothetical protein [Ornithinibacillus halotolerans]|uniref:Uncharacterized protein n=1 Tax=Ornithinibacillus halotolerans TaxID=1274357 RepID=A0A916W9A2_9BACI|nr:hypothetical protein [Ornithinibacillus halotolerans]GGA77744.1 hypothetical protein GCM10008025_21540 [Ornithinibacillus halotolerans]
MWDKLVGLYVAAILAGFALAFVPTSSLITPAVKPILALIGGVIIIIFAIAIIHLAFKALFHKHSK